jgi:hypothetical protein
MYWSSLSRTLFTTNKGTIPARKKGEKEKK